MNTSAKILVVTITTAMLYTTGARAGSLEPTNAPGPTMHSLEEIYQKQVATHTLVASLTDPQSLSPDSASVPAGYYAATNLAQVETDLVPEKIQAGTVIFGKTGTLSTIYQAGVPKTGLLPSQSARTGDDANLQAGVALPVPRFTDQENGVVTDNLTGLEWVKAPHSLPGNLSPLTWNNAVDLCNNLVYAGHDDWRMPNIRELHSLVNYAVSHPVLPIGHPFVDIQNTYYWSSTLRPSFTGRWSVDMEIGLVNNLAYTTTNYVWPVRGGQ